MREKIVFLKLCKHISLAFNCAKWEKQCIHFQKKINVSNKVLLNYIRREHCT